jgi:hypothetical protein
LDVASWQSDFEEVSDSSFKAGRMDLIDKQE